MAKIDSEAIRPAVVEIGTVVCEPQLGRTPFVVIGPGETAGTVLLAPLNQRKRRNRASWYYAFAEDLETLAGREGPLT